MRITVFTPAYNRGYIIEKLYHSLQRQNFHDFEWLVVDDGSTDDTQMIFQRIMQEENEFPIRYVKVENGGKHRAINQGVKLAKGELFFIVDSDDYIMDNALAIIDSMEKTLTEKEEFCGICGQRGHDEKNAMGSTFSGDMLDISILERPKYNIYGEKAEVFYTNTLRNYPFPEFEGEKFLTECVVWDKMAADGYKLRFFNQILIICKYLPDGLTSNIEQLQRKNPRGQGWYLYQSVQFGKIRGKQKWNEYLRYFYIMRGTIPFGEMARNLHIPSMLLWNGLFILRVCNKIRAFIK